MSSKHVACQLVLASGGAADDPKGAVVLQEVKEAAGSDADIIVRDLPPWCALEINALQQASTLVIQKSLRGGFGLTVTEARWKGKPTIAGAVGGIPNQIIHKLTGVLVHSVEGCGFPIRDLLTHPEFARRIGMNGRERVRENFLTSDIKRWLLLFCISALSVVAAGASYDGRGNRIDNFFTEVTSWTFLSFPQSSRLARRSPFRLDKRKKAI
jgi:trehalose synthase